jgi:hypothetical protein
MDESMRVCCLPLQVLQRKDPGAKVSDVVYTRRLLRCCGLATFEQREVLEAARATWHPLKIEDALKPMDGDSHKDDKYRRTVNGNAPIPTKPPWMKTF